MKLKFTLLLSVLLVWAYSCVAVIRYVRWNATGANNGTSWANAFTALQSAISVATAGDEIWVAAGTYRPAPPGGPRTSTFMLNEGVKIYGGFNGTETLLNQRDYVSNVCILSGDLNGNDIGFTNNTENVYHVVTGAANLTNATVLDGFTISGGNANGGFCPTGCGGGILLRISGANNNSPMIGNLIVTNNSANYGSAIWCGTDGMTAATPAITAKFYNITVFNNRAISGNGTFIVGGPNRSTIANVLIHNNTVSGQSAGFQTCCNYSTAATARLTVINSTVANNIATSGCCGGVNLATGMGFYQNMIIWGNTATSSPQIGGTGGTINVSYSDVQGGYVGTGNINANPLFVNPAGGDFNLSPGSPCIDAGDNSLLPVDFLDIDKDGDVSEILPLDRAYNPRIHNGTVNMGAYEAPVVLPVEQLVLSGTYNQHTIRLHWKVAAENPLTTYEVQLKPADAPNFTTFYTQTANGSNEYTTTYSPLVPQRYLFRVVAIEADNQIRYSNTIELFVTPSSNILISPPFPNPSNSISNLYICVNQAENLRVTLLNQLGQPVGNLLDKMVPANEKQIITIDKDTYPSGVYIIRVETLSSTQQFKLVIQ